jgi:rhodanese-related sulfurtransferase
MLKEGSPLWLIDVRGLKAFQAEHIEGSVSVPSAALKYKKFPPNKKLIIVDDSLGQKSSRESAAMLVKNGYERVYVLDGGIVSWKSEGFPVVGKRPVVRGVTADEIRWAMETKIPVKIFDLTSSPGRADSIRNSEPVSGKDVPERVEKLRELLKKGEGKGLSDRLKKPPAIVLVFSASEDAARLVEKIRLDSKGDVRYLIGGYEAFMAGKDKQAKAAACPTCPGK